MEYRKLITCSWAALANISRYFTLGSAVLSSGGHSFFLPRFGAGVFSGLDVFGVSSITTDGTEAAEIVGRDDVVDFFLIASSWLLLGGVGERGLPSSLFTFSFAAAFSFAPGFFFDLFDCPLPWPFPLGDFERDELLERSFCFSLFASPISPPPWAPILPPLPLLDAPLEPRMPSPRPLGCPQLRPLPTVTMAEMYKKVNFYVFANII